MKQAKTTVSPKELAKAIGVSESSLKRWVDEGVLQAVRTPGGHRRIPVVEAVRFVRQTGTPLLRPDLLGLADAGPAGTDEGDDPVGEVIAALLTDEPGTVRRLVMGGFFDGRPVAELGDGPLREALAYVGELWQHRDDGVLIEHRATDTCFGLLQALRALLPAPPPSAPAAVGGGPPDDPYLVATLMADVVLTEVGYRAHNLGPETPIATLKLAAERYGARLVWRSYSVDVSPALVLAEYEALQGVLARGGHFVVGGRGLLAALPRRPRLQVARSMGELAALGRQWLAEPEAPQARPKRAT